MSIGHRFRWALAGNVLYAVSQWLILVVVSRLGDLSMLGRYGLGLALCAPVFLLTSMGLRNAIATDTRHEFAMVDYLRARSLGAVIAVVALLAIVAARRDSAEAIVVIGLVGASKLIEAFSDLTYGAFQRATRHDLCARSLIARAVIGLAGFAIALHATGSIAAALVALCAAWMLVLLVHDQPSMSGLPGPAPGSDHAGWRRLVVSVAPLGVVTALVSLSINIPRYAVDHYLGEEALGVFTAVSYSLVVVSLVIVTAAQATLTPLSAHWARQERAAFRRLLVRLCAGCAAVGAVGVVGALLGGRAVLVAVFGEPFGVHDQLLLQTMVAAAISAVAGGLSVGAMATRRFSRLLVPHVVVALATLSTSFALVARWGLAGAGWALIAAMGLSLVPPIVVLVRAGWEDEP